MGRILDADGQKMTTFHKEDGKTIIKTSEDVGEILRLNSIDRNHSNPMRSTMRHAARIPQVVFMQWREELKKQGRNPDPLCKENRPWLLAKLNSRDYLKLRTSEDRL